MMPAEWGLNTSALSSEERVRFVAAAARMVADRRSGGDPWALLKRAALDLRVNPEAVDEDAAALNGVVFTGVVAAGGALRWGTA